MEFYMLEKCFKETDGYKPSYELIYGVLHGSRLYNLCDNLSDYDYIGVFLCDNKSHFYRKVKQLKYKKDNIEIVFFELHRFVELLFKNSPNHIETLFVPEDKILVLKDCFKPILENRNLFITNKLYCSLYNYAVGQFKNSKNQNKKVNLEKEYEKGIYKMADALNNNKIDLDSIKRRFPKHIYDYILIIKDKIKTILYTDDEYKKIVFMEDEDIRNLLPPTIDNFIYLIQSTKSEKTSIFSKKIPNLIKEMLNWNKDNKPILWTKRYGMGSFYGKCSQVEHSNNLYRVYPPIQESTYFISNDNIMCSSISKEVELNYKSQLIFVNYDAFKEAKVKYNQYWEWVSNRNNKRWISDYNVNLDIDSKKAMHCIRNLYSCIYLLNHRKPEIEFNGNIKQFLLDIKHGKYTFKEIEVYVETLSRNSEGLFKNSKLPKEINREKVEQILMDIYNNYFLTRKRGYKRYEGY
jgi:predicted nucleotidyltransferase